MALTTVGQNRKREDTFVKSHSLGTVWASLFALSINASAYAADYSFTKIVDTNDTIPGRTDTFTVFDLPSLAGRDVAFAGDRNSNYSGVFTYIGGNLNLVADSTMQIPGGSTNFDTLELPIIDQGNVVFVGTQDSGFEAHGIYTDLGGSLRVIADHNTDIPGGTGTFGFFTDESHDFNNGVVAFKGWASSQSFPGGPQGIYTDINGALGVVVDNNTPIPNDTENFDGFSINGIDGADVAFSGGGASGVWMTYLNSSGTISIMFTQDTSYVDVAAQTFVSVAVGDSLLTNVGGTLQLVAETNDLTPDGIGSFTFFDNLAVDGDELAFTAVDDNGDGNIYRYFEGMLDEVISEGDILDDKSVIDLNMYFAGLDDGAIAFRVDFDDGSSGLYLAEVVPIPPAIWLFGSGLLGLVGIARRKKAA